jgi:hypothetical protein
LVLKKRLTDEGSIASMIPAATRGSKARRVTQQSPGLSQP